MKGKANLVFNLKIVLTHWYKTVSELSLLLDFYYLFGWFWFYCNRVAKADLELIN